MIRKRKKEKSTDLFNLVKSLTMQEKRYFNIFSQRHVIGEENNYLKLFDAIDQQEEYDEEALLKKFAKEKFAKQLHVAKNYLSELILKSLRFFHSKRTIGNEMRELLDYAEILFYKKQWKLLFKLIKKAKKIAWNNELFIDFLHVSELEMRYMLLIGHTSGFEKFKDAAYLKEDEALNKWKNFQQYRKLSHQYSILLNKKGSSPVTKQDKLPFDRLYVSTDLLKKKEYALSAKALIQYYQLKGFYYYEKEDFKNSLEIFIQLCDFIRKSPNRLKQHISSYLSASNNIVLMLLKSSAKFEKILEHLNGLKEIPTGVLLNNDQIFVRYYSRLLDLFVLHGRFIESREWIKAVEFWINKLEDKALYKIPILDLYYNLAYLNFGTGEFKQALKWINIIEWEYKNEIREDIACHIKVLRILIYYELNNLDVISYQIRNTSNFLSQKMKLYKTEKVVFDFLEKKIIKVNSKRELIEIFKELKSAVQQFQRDENEKKATQYFNFIRWVESKIQNRPFAKITCNS